MGLLAMGLAEIACGGFSSFGLGYPFPAHWVLNPLSSAASRVVYGQVPPPTAALHAKDPENLPHERVFPTTIQPTWTSSSPRARP